MIAQNVIHRAGGGGVFAYRHPLPPLAAARLGDAQIATAGEDVVAPHLPGRDGLQDNRLGRGRRPVEPYSPR